MKAVLVVAILLAANCANAWRFFKLGRIKNGNLGVPWDIIKNSENRSMNIETEWFDQKLNHFDPTNTKMWKQRFYVNDGFFNKNNTNGPVFLMIGGEGEATEKWMKEGAWITYAERFGALCFQLEHRYYGKSHPTEDLSTKNLKFLSSEQALADLAYFITSMNEQYSLGPDVKWIAFGGSYPGSLAAWLRYKYPHLVHGAMSASGPLLAQANFKDYFRVVDQALATHSDTCVKAIKQGTEQVNILLKHMVGQRNINGKFNLCDPIEKSVQNKKDISNFFESIAGNFAGIVQYNKDNRQGNTANITIDTLCDIMVNESMGPPVTRLAAVNSVILKASNQSCLDYKYDKMINDMRNTSWSSEMSEGGRQWTYQTCTEFGFFQTSDYRPQVFGDYFPEDFFAKQCTDIFGPNFDEALLKTAIERTNIIYGDLDLQVSNVVFVHGSIDPWHALGITKTRNENAPAIYIQGTAHCANMYPESEKDLPQLKAAREQIAKLISSWIN